MDCGGKRSATPLWIRLAALVVHAKALSPLRSASAVQKPSPISRGFFSWHLFLTTRPKALPWAVLSCAFGAANGGLKGQNKKARGRAKRRPGLNG